MLGTILLCFNVYQTFKALKPTRRTSANAALMRKRGMKGCMCLWLVWGSWSILEVFADRTLRYVVPFYATTKGLVVFFLIVSRTKGAEPIYLYLIRPALRPHIRSVDVFFRVLDALFSIVLALFLGPLLLIYTRLVPKLFHLLRPTTVAVPDEFPRPSGIDISNVVYAGHVPASRDEALRAAEAIYQRIDHMQSEVRTRRDMQQESDRNRHSAMANQTHLRVRRRNMDQQPASLEPMNEPAAPAPPAPIPKHKEVLLQLSSDSSPPPAYTQPAPVSDPTRSSTANPHVYPPLPPVDRSNNLHNVTHDSSLLSEDFHTLHDINVQALRIQDVDMDIGTLAQTEPAEELESDDMDVDAVPPIVGPSRPRPVRATRDTPASGVSRSFPASIQSTIPSLPQKREHETPTESNEVGTNRGESAVAKKKRRITPDGPLGAGTENRNGHSDNAKLGPPQRVRAPRGQPAEDVETFRVAPRDGAEFARTGKRNLRDFSDGIERITQAPTAMKKSATSTDVRRPLQQSAGVELQSSSGRGAPLRRTQSKDDVRQPPQRAKAMRLVESHPIAEHGSEEEELETATSEDEGADEFFGRTTRSRGRGTRGQDGAGARHGNRVQAPIRGRGRSGGVGRAVAAGTRGGRGRSVSGA